MRKLLQAIAAVAAIACGMAQAEPSIQTASTSPAELDYLQQCSGCHQADGSGSVTNRVPPLPGSVGHFLRSAAGRAFLVQVGGVAQSPLSDAAIAALLNWLLPTFDAANLPASFTPFSAAEVAAARAHRPGDIAALRESIATSLAADGHRVARY
jgi:cytochrome c553